MVEEPSQHQLACQTAEKGDLASLAIYKSVTKRILDALAEDIIPWRKPWRGRESMPCNALTNRSYRGVNIFLLGLAPYRDHRWLTFRQAQSLGGSIRRGEKSSVAVFWKRWEIEKHDPQTGVLKKETIPLIRQYQLFNIEQCEGLQIDAIEPVNPLAEEQRIVAAETFIRSMPNAPSIQIEGGKPRYKPGLDTVYMTPIDWFESVDSYYSVLLHELGHSSGHESRLNRPAVMGKIEFGSCDYSREELVAELTSAFCCAILGLDNSLIENSASYVNSWLVALLGDPKAIVVAAGQAQRAADYIQGLLQPSEPVRLVLSA